MVKNHLRRAPKDTTYYILSAFLIVLILFIVLLIVNYSIKIYGPKATPQGIVQDTKEQNGNIEKSAICGKIAGWNKYKDDNYNFSIEYPQNFQIKYDNSQWPNAIIHFQDKSVSESYLGQIEWWDSELGYYFSYDEEPIFIAKHPEKDKWITINYQNILSCDGYQESWDKIIESFQFN